MNQKILCFDLKCLDLFLHFLDLLTDFLFDHIYDYNHLIVFSNDDEEDDDDVDDVDDVGDDSDSIADFLAV